jgi:endonuclease YncB( thermonuclease family)
MQSAPGSPRGFAVRQLCFACAAALLIGIIGGPASASACAGLSEGPDGVVSAVLDGNTFVLDSGIVVRLIGAVAPFPAGKRAGSVAEPLAEEAKAALGQLILGKAVTLGLDEEETDRYGHMEAQVFLAEPGGAWVEAEMIARGLARVEPRQKLRRCLAELIAAEAGARARALGIWADPYYSVRDAGDPAILAGRTGHYEVIEGEVIGTGESRGRVYLDFGRVWKDDVTATIDQKARGLFADMNLDPLSLKGQRVRARGWIENRDGPLIQIDVPEQLEVLGSE